VDLVVGGHDIPLRIDHEGAVGDLVARPDGNRADLHHEAALPGDLAQGGEGGVLVLRPYLIENGPRCASTREVISGVWTKAAPLLAASRTSATASSRFFSGSRRSASARRRR
jgi:hypothetical protein